MRRARSPTERAGPRRSRRESRSVARRACPRALGWAREGAGASDRSLLARDRGCGLAGNSCWWRSPGGQDDAVPRALLESGLAERATSSCSSRGGSRPAWRRGRVAEELGEEVGKRVGYTVRFEDVSSRDTRLRFVTEGVLTRRLVSDPELRGVSVVVLDELHERSLHAISRSRSCAISSAIPARPAARRDERDPRGRARRRVPRRAGDPGPRSPLRHRESSTRRCRRSAARAPRRAAVKRALREEQDGHVLVFLPGAAEIRRRPRRSANLGGVDVLPLHRRFSACRSGPRGAPERSPQGDPRHQRRRDVAHDRRCGRGRRLRASRGSRGTRRGRAFRRSAPSRSCQASRPSAPDVPAAPAPGARIRLYTARSRHAPAPRSPRDPARRSRETILSLRARGVRDPLAFPFFEPPRGPRPGRRRAARRLGTVAGDGSLTAIGRRRAGAALHPARARAARVRRARSRRARRAARRAPRGA